MRATTLARAALAVYAVALSTATHWPRLVIEGPVPNTDKLLHFAAFGVLTVLIALSGLVGRPFTRRASLLAALAAAVYAAVDELTQGIPVLGRTTSWLDYLADLGGIAIATALLQFAPAVRDRVVEMAGDGAGHPGADRSEADEEGRMAAGVRTVSGLTLVSRVAGLARDLITVRIFGDTVIGSAFAMAFAVPNLFRRLFGEGALSAAFLPDYARLLDDDRPRAHAFATLTLVLLTVVTGLLTIGIELGLWWTLSSVPADAERSLSLRLVMAMLPFMPLISIAAVLGGMLQCHDRFGPWAAAPILLNLTVIAAAVPFFAIPGADPVVWAYVISGAVVLSGAVQVAWSLPALRGVASWRFDLRAAGAPTARMARRLGPVLLGMGTLQLNSVIDTLIAMYPNLVGPTLPAWLPGGLGGVEYPLDGASNAVLFYSQRLYQFPLGVFGIAVATVAFPALSRAARDPSRFAATLRRALRLSLFIGIPASVGLVLVRDPLVRVLYSGGGGFSEDGLRAAAGVVAGYGSAVWMFGAVHVLTRACYAHGLDRAPVVAAGLMVATNLTLNLVLIWPLGEAGLAWSTAIASCGQGALLWWWLARRLRSEGATVRIIDAQSRRSVGRTFARTAVMAAAIAPVLAYASRFDVWLQHAMALGLAVAIGAGVYGSAALAGRAEELRWLIRRKLQGGGG